jgi:hypothetical protein
MLPPFQSYFDLVIIVNLAGQIAFDQIGSGISPELPHILSAADERISSGIL